MADEIVSLTPEQQATYQQNAGQSAPTPQNNQPVTLSPEQQAQYRQATGIVDPFQDFNPQQLADLTVSDPDNFDLVGRYSERKDLHSNPELNQKVADAYNLLKQRSVLADLPSGKRVVKTLWDTAKGFGKQAWNYASAFAAPAAAAIAAVKGEDDAAKTALDQGVQQLAENIAGTESAATGVAGMVERGVKRASRAVGLSKPLTEYTPEEKLSDLFGAMGEVSQQGEISRGHGEVLGTLGGHIVKELEQQGLPVRPEEVQQLAAGDPLSWAAMGGAFKGAGALAPGAFTRGLEAATAGTGQALAKVGGTALTGAAKVAEGASKVVESVAKPVSAVAGAITGAAKAGPGGAILGAGAGLKAGEAIAAGAKKAAMGAEQVGEIGRQIAGAPVKSAYAQLGKDLLESAPAAAADVVKGGAFDVGLAAGTAETPQEKQGVGIGLAFGLLGAANRTGRNVISGQIIAPREYGTRGTVPSSGQFPAFDAAHTQALAEAAPGVRERVNAVRQFVKGASPGTDVFLFDSPQAVENALVNVGVSPESARALSANEGFFTADIPGRDGSTRRVILARNVEAAPHEAFHAVQDVLGESANRQLDTFIRDQFDDATWNSLADRYAKRIGGEGSWQEVILNATRSGNAEAMEKIYRDIYNQVSAASDGSVNEATVRDLAQKQWAQTLAEAVKRNPGVSTDEVQRNLWRDVLSPAEAQGAADRYIAREVAAENFDALFKHSGPTLEAGTAIPERLARVVADLVQSAGGNPLQGRSSEIGQFPLNPDIIQATQNAATQGGNGRVTIEPPVSRTANRAATIPNTPAAQQEAAQEARDIATSAPETPFRPGGTQTAREILGAISEAIAGRSGVKLNYLSAPNEPAAAISSNRLVRRAAIEAYRTMPAAARALWEKTFFPERVIKLKDGKFQVLGWSPEVFAANAHRLAQFADRASFGLPYEVDPATKSFSEAGWKQLYQDAQTFIQNQSSGRTGSGEELIVPASATDAGAFKPPTSGRAEPLAQEKADVISALFGFKLPETPRITGGKTPLNVVGQDIAEATIQGRTETPARPREAFGGPAAERLGIEGREIREVNPFRNRVEEAAANSGVEAPSFIEAIQRLNAENIVDVAGAPEHPDFRGNTLTLSAGFQPKTEAGKALEDQGYKFETEGSAGNRTIRVLGSDGSDIAHISSTQSGPKDASIGMVVVQTGHQKQGIGEALYRELGAQLKEDGVTSVAGNLVDARSTKLRGKVFPGSEFTAKSAENYPYVEAKSPITPESKFQPTAENFMEKMRDLTPEEFSAESKSFTGKYGGGITGWAFEAGSKAKTADDVAAFRSAAEQFKDMAKEAMKAGNMALAMSYGTRAQGAREAFEAATGTHLDGSPGGADFIVKHKDASYKPPMPPKGAEAAPAAELIGGQFQPSSREDVETVRSAAIRLPDGQIFTGPMHALAIESAKAEGIQLEDYTAGFTTSKDRFVDRNEALTIAQAADQIPANKKSAPEIRRHLMGVEGLDSYDLKSNAADAASQFQPKANEEVRKVADDYVGKIGLPLHPWTGYERVNDQTAKEIADAYEAAKSNPSDPKVKAAYDALNQETRDQWDTITKAGVKMEPWLKTGQPYANSKEMTDDVASGHLWFFPTDAGFGSAKLDASHPMLADSGVKVNGKSLPFNDVFRAVHDYFGHAKEGYEFGPRGELNAYLSHSRMYSDAAKPAMAAETLGQNSWVNFGPQLRDASGNLRKAGDEGYVAPADRQFAEQKAVLLPEELVAKVEPAIAAAPKKEDWKFKPASGGFSKAWILPNGQPIQLGGQWHHDYLSENPAITTKYKLPENFTEQDRAAALKKGFARINYSVNNGQMTVEARLKDWRSIAPVVEKMFEANAGKIDSMHVTLFNDNATKIADSDSASLFRYDDKEKGKYLPFITGSEPRTQAQPQIFSNEKFDEEIARIRSGASGGQTFTPAGDVWTPKGAVDVVSLASVNVPLGDLTREAVESAVSPYKQLLSDPNVVAGVFSFSKDSTPTVSIDINAVVPQKYRDNTLAFARDNDQAAIWDAAKGEVVDSGGKGNTRLQSSEEILDALNGLTKGKPVDVDQILKDNKLSSRHGEELSLEGLGGKQALSTREISDMTKADLAEHYPEAVVPRSRDELIPSEITKSPLYKAAGSRDAAVDAFARKLVEFAKEWDSHPNYQNGLKWYSEFTPKLKKTFGKDAQIMAELLAATSPNTPPTANFAFALDALEGYKSGRFSKKIAKFDEGLEKIADDSWEPWYNKEFKAGNITDPPAEPTPAAFLARWIEKFDLLPRQSNGKLYGMHSTGVLRVFARKWLENTSGPKTQNFVQNLIGTGHGATIDVWADRTMRRVGYSGSKERWRILPKNGTGVSDEDFHFSQAAFAKAADELGIKPDALQGGLWFAEKQLWADKGWGRLDLGDYRKEIAKTGMLLKGIEQRHATQKAATKAPTAKAGEFDFIEPRNLRE